MSTSTGTGNGTGTGTGTNTSTSKLESVSSVKAVASWFGCETRLDDTRMMGRTELVEVVHTSPT